MIWEYGDSSILSIASSIRNCFGLETFSASNPRLDAWLRDHSFDCVVLFLVDAMGCAILEKHLEPDSFLRKSVQQELVTVFPTATTAATTALRTGRVPSATGWFGWNQYFEEEEDLVIPFFGKGMYSEKDYGKDFAYSKLPVRFTVGELNEKGIPSTSVWPSWGNPNPCEDIGEIMEKIKELSGSKQFRHIYAYWDVLDTMMHRTGTASEEVHAEVLRINRLFEQFAASLPEGTGVIVTADHGQTDSRSIDLRNVPDLLACLNHLPSMEARFMAFSVKPEKKDAFVRRFESLFGEEFLLLKTDEALGLFGGESTHRKYLGDYIACSKGSARFALSDNAMKAIGDHGSFLEDEKRIPLILLGKEIK